MRGERIRQAKRGGFLRGEQQAGAPQRRLRLYRNHPRNEGSMNRALQRWLPHK